MRSGAASIPLMTILLTFLLTLLGACGTFDQSTMQSQLANPDTSFAIQQSLAGTWRNPSDSARDKWRNPAQTLAFFQVNGSDVVVEIWPGRGWYTDVIAPFVAANGGQFIAAHFDPMASPDPARQAVLRDRIATFAARYAADAETFGTVEVTALSTRSEQIAPAGSVDVVLTFRNIHNWMARGHEVKAFEDAFRALRGGGVFGVVEHRLPPAADFDPKATNGYVHEAFVVKLATDAGFVLDAKSEINANPLDTADHPYGVWTLPPVSRVGDENGNQMAEADAARYRNVGESDRMTLRFIKPKEST